MLEIQPLRLVGRDVVLRPLSIRDAKALTAAASDGELWNIATTTVPRPEEVTGYIRKALELKAAGHALPFTIVVPSLELVVGTTRYLNIDAEHHRLEIGSTWLARTWQRSFVNTECKLLLLQHAFERLGCNAVEFRTDVRNRQSRAAIKRVGATQDGILRSHMVMRDGHVRDSAVYSIVAAEWPETKRRLLEKLRK